MTNQVQSRRWEIRPYVGVGELEFGLTRDQARQLLGAGWSVFRRWPYHKEYDVYPELGLTLEYDDAGILESVEASAPCPIEFGGVRLVGATAGAVQAQLAKLGLHCRRDDGCFFDSAGFALYEPRGVVKAVTVYRRGYYDSGDEATPSTAHSEVPPSRSPGGSPPCGPAR